MDWSGLGFKTISINGFVYLSSMNTNKITREVIDEHLSKGIPAMSNAAGLIPVFGINGKDINLNGDAIILHPNGWLRIDDETFL